MCNRTDASTIRMEIEEQIAREALHIYRMVIETVKDPQAAVRLVNGVMVGTDYVMQYRATQFSNTLPEFQTADKVSAPMRDPNNGLDLHTKHGTTSAPPMPAPVPEAPKAETPRPTGPAVQARPFGTPTPAASKPADPPKPASSLTIIKCSVCGTDTERREHPTIPGTYIRWCPKEKEYRTLGGKPPSVKGA